MGCCAAFVLSIAATAAYGCCATTCSDMGLPRPHRWPRRGALDGKLARSAACDGRWGAVACACRAVAGAETAANCLLVSYWTLSSRGLTLPKAGIYSGLAIIIARLSLSRWSLRRPLRILQTRRINTTAANSLHAAALTALYAIRRDTCHLSSHASPRSSVLPRRGCRSSGPHRANGCRTTCLCRRHPLI